MSFDIAAVKGDITTIHTDAIVNAANPALRGGGGVDGAIHQAAGARLLPYEQWMYPHGTRVACPVVTPAFDLPAKHIIHVPGPDVRELVADGLDEGHRRWFQADEDLWNAYARSMAVAGMLGSRTVTFPSLSTGIFGFPLERAVALAHSALSVSGDREQTKSIELVWFVAFDDATYDAFKTYL